MKSSVGGITLPPALLLRFWTMHAHFTAFWNAAEFGSVAR